MDAHMKYNLTILQSHIRCSGLVSSLCLMSSYCYHRHRHHRQVSKSTERTDLGILSFLAGISLTLLKYTGAGVKYVGSASSNADS